MLVEDKFIYISLPRCASTSFVITCLRNDIKIKHADDLLIKREQLIKLGKINLSLNNEELADNLIHGHEKLTELTKKFGNEYDIISVRRNKYERFISLWKHIIDLTTSMYSEKVVNKLKSLKVDDLLVYRTDDLISDHATSVMVIDFIKKLGIYEDVDDYMIDMFLILVKPTSYWDNNDPRIKWFDFDKLDELEKWVTQKLNKPFVLEKSNGSQHFDCGIELNQEFMDKYDTIYDYYHSPKKIKTLL